MTQKSWIWGGSSIGDASYAPFSDDEWTDIWNKILCSDNTLEGVIADYGTELRVDKVDNSTVRVTSGSALVDGCFYENDADVDLTISSDGTYRVVLRKDWTAQTVRASSQSGATVTQTDGSIWEIKLADVVRTAGVITVTDARNFLHFNTSITTGMMESEIFPYTAMDTGVPVMNRRWGGSATDWNSPGSTGYTVDEKAVLRVGTYDNIIPIGATKNTFIILFTSFTAKPLFFIRSIDVNVLNYDIRFVVNQIETSFVLVDAYRDTADSSFKAGVHFMWMAVGEVSLLGA